MSTEASLAAYGAIIGSLSERRGSVFAVISNSNGRTIRESCKDTGWPYNTVSARIFELTELGLIKPQRDALGDCTRDGQTIWIASTPEEVYMLQRQRAAHKKARKSPRVKRLETALREALELLEAGGDRHNAWRAALNDTPWPPPATEPCPMLMAHNGDGSPTLGCTCRGAHEMV